MDDREIMQSFRPLWDDLRPEDAFAIKKPLLAHYTTIQTLEKYLRRVRSGFPTRFS